MLTAPNVLVQDSTLARQLEHIPAPIVLSSSVHCLNEKALRIARHGRA